MLKARHLRDETAGAGVVLGLDTGAPIAALAIVSSGRVLAERSRPTASHCATLPDAVDELLRAADVRIADLRGIAVGIGPGSFTGLRVGLSYVKGLAAALAIPVVGVPSLDAIALSADELGHPRSGSLICPVLDARKGEIYAALYRVGPDALEKIIGDSVTVPEQLFSRIGSAVMLVGDAKARDVAAVLGKKGVRSSTVALRGLQVRGRYVAMLGAVRLARGEADSLSALEPLYVRSAEATFTPTAAGSPAIGREGLWRAGKKISFGGLQTTTRN